MTGEGPGRETISIMADFGMGPYAWHRGGNIADATSGFPAWCGVSKGLEADLAEWVVDFERNFEEPTFDWGAFHRRGIELARRLKAETGGRFEVEYHKCIEDPARGDLNWREWDRESVITIRS